MSGGLPVLIQNWIQLIFWLKISLQVKIGTEKCIWFCLIFILKLKTGTWQDNDLTCLDFYYNHYLNWCVKQNIRMGMIYLYIHEQILYLISCEGIWIIHLYIRMFNIKICCWFQNCEFSFIICLHVSILPALKIYHYGNFCLFIPYTKHM